MINTPSRLRGIDAARGTAMVLVCLSHFVEIYFPADLFGHGFALIIQLVTMVASPTFMLLSGMMVGFLHQVRGGSFERTARAFIGRGLFLLTVGHVLMFVTLLPRHGLAGAIRIGLITDAIGVALVVSPFLVRRLDVRRRVLVAALMFAVFLFTVVAWTPTGGFPNVLRFVFIGPQLDQSWWNFPLLPWVALHLLGTTIGTGFGRMSVADAIRPGESRLLRLGLAAFAFGAAAKLGYWIAKDAGFVRAEDLGLYFLTSPLGKVPPSLPYLSCFGGLGLIMTATVLMVERRRLLNPVIEGVSLLGRASLFVFVVQYCVYYVGLYYLDLPYQSIWPLYFLGTLWLIFVCAKAWDRRGYNRYLNMLDWFPRLVPATLGNRTVRAWAPARRGSGS